MHRMHTTTGISLNNCQLTGPRLQDDLINIMLRFRTYRYALTADIIKIFRQVAIHKDDQKYQRIFWRDSPSELLQVFELTRVAYGQAAAPYFSIKALQQCSLDYQQEFPMAAHHTLA